MKDKLIIPYDECVQLALLKDKKNKLGYSSFTNEEKKSWESLKKKEIEVEKFGRAWVEQSTGVVVWTKPTIGYLVKRFFGMSRNDDIRWL